MLYVNCLAGYEVDFSSHVRVVPLAYYRITVRDIDTNKTLYVIVTFTELANSDLVESL